MKRYTLLKAIISGLLAIGCFYISFAFAQGGSLGEMASGMVEQVGSIAKLITAASYMLGIAFAVIAMLKFKAHRDNPTSVPISVPVMFLFIAAGLLFLPGIFKAAGESLGVGGETVEMGEMMKLE